MVYLNLRLALLSLPIILWFLLENSCISPATEAVVFYRCVIARADLPAVLNSFRRWLVR